MLDELHRLVLCDRDGVELWPITSLVDDFKLTEQISKPTSVTFTVDESDKRIKGVHTDGRPFLEYICRTVKYYRWEFVPNESRERFVHRFTGYVWPLEDNGDENTVSTGTVTCYDPLHVLNYRLARDAAGLYTRVPFTTTQVGSMLSQLVDRTNTFGGATGLITAGGILGTTPTANVEWRLKYISECIAEMAPRMDIRARPNDSQTMQHAILDIQAKRGIDLPNLRLAWNDQPQSLSAINRTRDPVDACTWLLGIGDVASSGNQLTSLAVDAAADAEWMHLEKVETYSDVKDQAHLNALVARDFLERKPPQDALVLTPTVDLDPWTQFNVGDTCRVAAGADLRGGIAERTERIYGFTYGVDNTDKPDLSLVTEINQ